FSQVKDMTRSVGSMAVIAGTLVAWTLGIESTRGADSGSVTGTVVAKGLSTSADSVISLQAPGLALKPPATPVPVDQKGKTFIPHVLAFVTGTIVTFLNSDPFAHNVFSPEGRYDLGSWQ